MKREIHPFERALSVSTADIKLELRGIIEITWADFWLNPRKLRGSDFLMRWSQGVWSEKRLIDVQKAIIAVECENSLWVAEKMPDFNTPMKAQKRLGGKFGLAKSAVLPTVIIKEEDRIPLSKWQEANNIPIHVWHVFFDRAYGLPFDVAQRLVAEGLILPTEQVFQAPGGATTKKAIYKYYYHYAYPLGEATERPKLIPHYIEDKNGHILPYVKFEGGYLDLANEAINILNSI
jgi:hypothetical protein